MNMDDYNNTVARLEISDSCGERMMDMIQEKKIRRHISKKAIIISVLAASLACGSIGAAAAFGGLRRNQEVWQQERTHVNAEGEVYSFSYEKFDHNQYDLLHSAAEVIPEGEALAQTEEVSVSVEDTFCDGRNLYCTFRVEADVPEAAVLDTYLIVTVNGESYRMPTTDNGCTSINVILLEDQTESGVYYGSLDFLLPEVLTEAPEISVTFKGFQCYRDIVDKFKNYICNLPDWVTIDVPVSVQTDARQITEINYEGPVLRVQSAEQSPAGIAVTYSYREEGDFIMVYDGNGNKITRKTDMKGYVFDGDWTTEFFEASGTDAITIRLLDINNDFIDEVTVSLK